jgi:hypothetical protein
MSDSCFQPETPPLPLTLANGEPLPESPVEAWRKHSAKNWKSTDPQSYALCLEMIREHGVTNISELERQLAEVGVNKSRQTITALLRTEFTTEELAQINAMTAQIAVMQGTAQMVKHLPDAKKSDLMAVAMTTKMAHDIERSLHGLPTEIREVREVSAQDKLAQLREQARQRLAEKSAVIVEAEVLTRGGGMMKPDTKNQNVSNQQL